MGRLRRPQLALIVLLAALAIGYVVDATHGHNVGPPAPVVTTSPARSESRGASRSTSPAAGGEVALSSLPSQVSATYRLIRQGGPFPYREDGEVFEDNERRLPIEPYGYYHSYTVVTPGSPDRGARRMITGKDGQFWYTPDHYVTFERVDVAR